jgi:NADH-quinone oxidoreductase subunit J
MERVVFYLLAGIIISFAIASVTSRKMLRSVIYLLFVLVAIAGIYFMADYHFLAAIQLAVYAGGIIVLIIFSVLLVQHIDTEMEVAKKSKRIITGLLCSAGLGVFLATIYAHPFVAVPNSITTTTSDIGLLLLNYEDGGFILPFEVVSVLLLAAMIGSIIIAKGGKSPQEKTEIIPPVEKEKSEAEKQRLPEKEVEVSA